jgi:hypothetical protein
MAVQQAVWYPAIAFTRGVEQPPFRPLGHDQASKHSFNREAFDLAWLKAPYAIGSRRQRPSFGK